jgi:hypothetical protein
VSFREVPPFDMLTGQPTPYAGFGEALDDSPDLARAFRDTESLARSRVSEMFGLQVGDSLSVAAALERVCRQIWSEGWEPQRGNVNLFVTDFGCVLTQAIRLDLGGLLVFRSPVDLSHVSLWWADKALEAFPFHKVYRRLQSPEGHSLSFFAHRVRQLVLEQR